MGRSPPCCSDTLASGRSLQAIITKGGAHRFGSVLHFIFQGMIEGPDNHYAIVEVYPDKLVIRGYGAQRDETLRWL